MTLEQKIDYIGGTGFAVRAIPALGVPALEMSDGPLGVRNNQKFPRLTMPCAGIGLAASWDPQPAERVWRRHRQGDAPGRVAFTSCLGPGVNMYRAPMNGRNFEYFWRRSCPRRRAVATGYITGACRSRASSSTVKPLFSAQQL